jgi:hypothetical protein
MAISDLFKIRFKKPTLTSDEQSKEQKKEILASLIEAAYSRLESLEILNSNGKVEDSAVISRLLAEDLINLSLVFFGKQKTVIGKDWKAEIANLKVDKLTVVYEKYDTVYSLSSIAPEKDEEILEDLESKLSGLLSDLEKYFRTIKSSELKTALSEQMFQWKVQAGVVSLLVVMILGSIVYRRVRYPDLAQTEVKVFFMTKEDPGPKEENAVSSKIVLEKKGEWVEYDFTLSKAMDVIEIRIDPIEQARVRLAIESLKFFDKAGKEIYTHDFIWGDDLLPKDKLSYGAISELKMSGKSVPGMAIEMESIGSDPFFHIKFPVIKNAVKARMKIRHIEAYKKFK